MSQNVIKDSPPPYEYKGGSREYFPHPRPYFPGSVHSQQHSLGRPPPNPSTNLNRQAPCYRYPQYPQRIFPQSQPYPVRYNQQTFQPKTTVVVTSPSTHQQTSQFLNAGHDDSCCSILKCCKYCCIFIGFIILFPLLLLLLPLVLIVCLLVGGGGGGGNCAGGGCDCKPNC